MIAEITPEKEYLDMISSIVQNERIRDTYVAQNRLKELNKAHPNNIVICHSENENGVCQVYYALESNPSFIGVHEFKLGKLKKENNIKKVLSLDKWINKYNYEVRSIKPNLEEIKNDVILWVNEQTEMDNPARQQFLDTLKAYRHYTGQIIVSFREYNGELKKLKPIIRLHNAISIDDLINFGEKKSFELWNREFKCKVKIVKTFWKQRLGTYYPDLETIRFSEHQNASLSEDEIYDTMLHEMVHWHLHTSERPHSDEDYEFIEECLRVGCGLSKAPSAQRAYLEYKKEKALKHDLL